ncbi:efflux transporter outer membrane subunit [Algiphilus sp.]|uniref:efflux transporter outer membrane subunit n=1 Tax=Algiphilus sp. TaxID=1872431 RepID=UPI003B52B792
MSIRSKALLHCVGLQPALKALFVAHLLSGCVNTPTATDPGPGVPEAFSEVGSSARPDAWWTAFNDAGLNATIDRALTDNLDLAGLRARHQAARAAAQREAGARMPDLVLDAQTRRLNGGESFDEGEDVSLNLASSWELDVWGRVHATVDAARLRALSQAEQVNAAAVSLTGQISRAWYALAAARQRSELAESQLTTNSQLLTLLENRFARGRVDSVDVLRQQREEEAAHARGVQAAAELETAAQRLSVLTGDLPRAGLPSEPYGFPELPALPDTGMPLELVRRRPDLRAAHAELTATDADLAAAMAARYPRITLEVGATAAANDAASLFDDWASRLASNVLAPLFTGGALKAEVDRTAAERERALYAYASAVLNAFQEVEVALIQEATARDTLTSLRRQVALTEQAFVRLRHRYFNGADSYLAVVTALRDLQALRREAVSAQQELMNARIALHLALAGPVPQPDSVP